MTFSQKHLFFNLRMNFEIEKLRTYNESNRHWACRKAFLEKNWDDYDHERVNCLSLCWTNKLFYGNNYCDTVTNAVREMLFGMKTAAEILNESDNAQGMSLNNRCEKNNLI